MRKMKIGILTFHKTDNYGAMLQAYALGSFLMNLGNQVFFLDYAPSFLIKKKYVRRTVVQKVFFAIKQLLMIKMYLSKKKKFKDFVKHNFTLVSLNESKKMDVVFVGSDQVWSMNLTNYDECYLGKKIESVKVAYAASCGNIGMIDERTEKLYAKYLPKFDNISVREYETSRFLSSLLKKPVPVVLDPTLLVHNELFAKKQVKKINEKYICVYDASHDGVLSAVERFAKKMSFKIVALSCDIAYNNRNRLVQNASIEEFLGYIAGAEFVFSTSYHGCALAISFRRDLYCFDTGRASSRSKDLLKQLHLDNRYVTIDDEIIPSRIDYEMVDAELESLRKSSFEYIKKCLEKK